MLKKLFKVAFEKVAAAASSDVKLCHLHHLLRVKLFLLLPQNTGSITRIISGCITFGSPFACLCKGSAIRGHCFMLSKHAEVNAP